MERVPVRGRPSPTVILGVILLIVALALLVAGLIYFTVAADKLPSFMGRVAGATVHRNRRAIAAVVLGVVVLIASIVTFARSRAPAR